MPGMTIRSRTARCSTASRARLPVGVKCVVAGVAIVASVPPWGWWPLAFVGLALVDHLVATSAGWRSRFARGALVAGAWLLPGTLWMVDFTPAGYVVVAAIYAAGLGAVLAVVPPTRGRAIALPGAIVVFELFRWYWPFGGVPLATIPMGQVGGPVAPVARLLGPGAIVAVVAVIGVALAAAWRRQIWVGTVAVLVALVTVLVASVSPSGRVTGEIDVAVVQGGGPQRTRANICENRTVFERHLAATDLVETPIDLVVWPENVVNPELDANAAQDLCARPLLSVSEAADTLSDLARRLDAHLVPGWFHDLDDDETVNYSTAVDPDGRVVDRYDKVRLVPFGEFVPLRSLIEPLAGDALPSHDVRPGTGPAVLDTRIGVLGVSISWEIFFEHRSRDALDHGAEILLNPTNGSSYWLTIVQTQQIASSRLRAIESGRWVLQAAPTGFSAIIDPDGNVVARTDIGDQAVLHGVVELRRGRTWATRAGVTPVALVAAGAMLAGRLLARRAEALTAAQRQRPIETSPGVDDQRDRTVVDQLDEHLGPEPTGGHRHVE